MAIRNVEIVPRDVALDSQPILDLARDLKLSANVPTQLYLTSIVERNFPSARAPLLFARKEVGLVLVGRYGGLLNPRPVRQMNEYLEDYDMPGIQRAEPKTILRLPEEVIRLIPPSRVR